MQVIETKFKLLTKNNTTMSVKNLLKLSSSEVHNYINNHLDQPTEELGVYLGITTEEASLLTIHWVLGTTKNYIQELRNKYYH